MKVAIMGYGTIGSGVAEVLKVNKDVIKERVGQEVELKYILDLREFEGDENEKLIVHDYKTIAKDKDVAIVVETMGGVEPAFTFVKEMLSAGKAVVTSNKALMADKGPELLALAKKNNTNMLFEAAVGGGIPVIRTINECLTGDKIDKITGILNGTTNYMLTNMHVKGAKYADALKEAQKLGYAEADPTADVEGYDACRKIAILTSLVSGKNVDYNEIPTEGISKISAEDFIYANLMGMDIKLLATATRVEDTYAVRVAPYLVNKKHLLYNVCDAFNGVILRGNMLGDSMYYGQGAGKLPTASAVVGDVVAAAKSVGKNIAITWDKKKLELANPNEQEYRYFVRTRALETIVERIFGEVEYIDADVDDECGFVTKDKMPENEFAERARALGPVSSIIRLAE